MSDEIDLEKIAEFMNSPINDEVDTAELENTLNYIDTQLTTVKDQTKELKTVEDAKIPEHTIDELTDVALNTLSKVDKKSDEVYDLFYQPIALKQDRSDVSKQSLIESIRLKVEMANSLAALAQAKAKLEMAKSKLQAGSGNVFINAQDGADVGINLKELWKDE